MRSTIGQVSIPNTVCTNSIATRNLGCNFPDGRISKTENDIVFRIVSYVTDIIPFAQLCVLVICILTIPFGKKLLPTLVSGLISSKNKTWNESEMVTANFFPTGPADKKWPIAKISLMYLSSY